MMKRWVVVWLMCLGFAVRVSAAEAGSSPDPATEEAVSPESEGDELENEVITSTEKDEVNTVQINFHAIMPEGFTKGYAYALSTKIEYEQESTTNNGKGIVNFYSDDVIYDDNYSIVLKVVKTGACGEGEFQYSLNGGFLWSEDTVIPTEGLYSIPDTGIWVEFFDNGGEFMVGDTYKTKIKGDMSKHDYTPVLAVVLVVLFLFMAGVYHHYASQRDRADQYELMRYERVK